MTTEFKTCDNVQRTTSWAMPTALMSMLRVLLVAWAVILLTFPVVASPLELTSDDSTVAAAGHLSALHDPTGRVTPADLAGMREAFKPIPGTFNAGYSPEGAWWLRLTVRPEKNAGGEWVLQIAAPYTDTIDVYAPADAGGTPSFVHSRTGALVPLSERDLYSHLYAVQLDLAAEGDQDIYIRLSGKRSLTAALSLWRESPFLGLVTSHAMTVAFIVGAASITALGAIVFGLWLRLPAFVYYGAYIGFAGLVILGNTGVSTFLFAAYPPSLLLRMQAVIGCLAIMTSTLVIRAIFCENGRNPVIAWILAGIGILSACFAIAAAFGQYGAIAPALHVGLLVVCLLLPWVAARHLLRGEPAAGWYFVGFTLYGLSGVWFCLMVLGLLPMSTYGERGYQLTSLINMATIFVGLATSVRAGARERRDLQSQLLAASQRNERSLEQAVAQRTSGLENEIAARRLAEEALIVAMREQRHFLAIVSHEFRTPLASIRVAIATIERGFTVADALAREEAARIVRTVGRLSHLIDAFLAEEVLDKTALHLRLRQVDLTALAKDVCREHEAQTSRHLRVEAPAELVVTADEDLVRLALENLVSNALRHSRGPVDLRAQSRDDGVVVMVTDDGPGIPEAEQEAIFERYYRIAGTPSGSGTGIGLSIVRKIARLHGGDVSVHSAPEVGSRFQIWLPCSPTPQALALAAAN